MANEPVTGNKFFDRAEILAHLNKRMLSYMDGFKQNLALIGYESQGKTSIIYKAVSVLDKDKFLPIYVEIESGSFIDFIERFIASCLFNLLRSKGLDIKEDIDYLISKTKKDFPKTYEHVKKIQNYIAKSQFQEAFTQTIDLPVILREDSKRLPIVILEEFHRLSTFKQIASPFSEFGKRLMLHREVMYIISSRKVYHAKEILAKKLNLLFGNFETIEIGNFDFKTSMDFCQSRLEALPESYRKFTASFCDGWPFYLDLITSEISRLVVKEGRGVSKDVIPEALDNLLFNSKGFLNQYFQKKLEGLPLGCKKVDHKKVLVYLAENLKVDQMAKRLGIGRDKLAKSLTVLLEQDVIARSGSFYYIFDKVFRFWLKNVYIKKMKSISTDIDSKRDEFMHIIEGLSSDFKNESSKDLYERVSELFLSFNNEFIQIESKSSKFIQFQEVHMKMFGKNGPYIFGKKYQNGWICQIREKPVSESEMREFLKDCHRLRFKFTRRLLIYTGQIDDCAKHIARTNNIWLWNLNNLNFVMDLFEKEKVLRT